MGRPKERKERPGARARARDRGRPDGQELRHL